MTPINGNVGGVFSFLPCVLLPVLAVRGALGYLEHLRTVDDCRRLRVLVGIADSALTERGGVAEEPERCG